MKTLPRVDVAVVGAGWTGLLLAKELTSRSAMKVVVLERGGARKTADYLDNMDELDYAIRLKMMQDISQETITLRHGERDKALPVRQYGSFLPGTGTGGTGEHWSGISYRFLPDSFNLLTTLKEKYGAAKLPEGHAIQDWGISYDELEPYYWKSELLLGISGKAGNLKGKPVAGGNISEGWRSHEYPTPPMKTPYLAAMFRDAVTKMGYHAYPLPAATTSQPYKNPDGVSRAGCSYCGYCERYGCMIGAKAQPTNVLMPVLAKRPNFELRNGCWARRVVSKDGKATGVIYVDPKGEEVFQPADIVVLASWTLNNTRLLLLSKLGGPNVGHNLTHHVSIPAAMCLFDKPLNRFIGAGSAGVAIGDFDGEAFDHTGLGFLRGGTMYAVCYGFRPMANFGVLPASAKAKWGSEWKKQALRAYDRTGRISYYGEHLAYKSNFMDLDPVYTDTHGDPLLRFTLDWKDNERKMAEYMAKKAAEVGRAMGAREVTPFPGYKKYEATRYQSTHIQGGAIMGADAGSSVVNSYQQCWTSPNVFVIGASAFPHNPSGNPTLTAMALTMRTADGIVGRYQRRPGLL